MDIQALRVIGESNFINLFKTIHPIELSVKLRFRNITQRSAANALKTRSTKNEKCAINDRIDKKKSFSSITRVRIGA